METMNQVSTAVRPRRREYSPEFKASVLQECHQPGASFRPIARARSKARAGVVSGHDQNPPSNVKHTKVDLFALSGTR